MEFLLILIAILSLKFFRFMAEERKINKSPLIREYIKQARANGMSKKEAKGIFKDAVAWYR